MSKLVRQLVDIPQDRLRPVRDRAELLTLLRYKLLEEAFEAIEASAACAPGFSEDGGDVRHLREELADCLEALMTLARAHGLSALEVEASRHEKFYRLGGFLPGRVYT